MSKKVAVVYATNKGNTKTVAEKLAGKIENSVVLNIADTDVKDLSSYDYLILGTSTIGRGDILKPWKDKLLQLAGLDLSEKTVALFALGNNKYHADTFAQSLSAFYKALDGKVKIEGAVPAGNYTFDTSEAVVNGSFVGLPIEQDNESDKTDVRIDSWLKGLKI